MLSNTLTLHRWTIPTQNSTIPVHDDAGPCYCNTGHLETKPRPNCVALCRDWTTPYLYRYKTRPYRTYTLCYVTLQYHHSILLDYTSAQMDQAILSQDITTRYQHWTGPDPTVLYQHWDWHHKTRTALERTIPEQNFDVCYETLPIQNSAGRHRTRPIPHTTLPHRYQISRYGTKTAFSITPHNYYVTLPHRTKLLRDLAYHT
jgi:hypothetical protein